MDHVPEGLLLLVGVEDLDLAERPPEDPSVRGLPPGLGVEEGLGKHRVVPLFVAPDPLHPGLEAGGVAVQLVEPHAP